MVAQMVGISPRTVEMKVEKMVDVWVDLRVELMAALKVEKMGW